MPPPRLASGLCGDHRHKPDASASCRGPDKAVTHGVCSSQGQW
ncbi:MAG: hypothetical protein WBI13_00130 [Synechococcus sp.]|nr:hypothetical protein [Synechococcus sp. MVIR-18-1]